MILHEKRNEFFCILFLYYFAVFFVHLRLYINVCRMSLLFIQPGTSFFFFFKTELQKLSIFLWELFICCCHLLMNKKRFENFYCWPQTTSSRLDKLFFWAIISECFKKIQFFWIEIL